MEQRPLSSLVPSDGRPIAPLWPRKSAEPAAGRGTDAAPLQRPGTDTDTDADADAAPPQRPGTDTDADADAAPPQRPGTDTEPAPLPRHAATTDAAAPREGGAGV